MLIALALSGLALSWWLTGWMRRYALSAQLIDHPNARGSHSAPTPRGGGVAIVVSFAALATALGAIGEVPPRMLVGLLVSGLLVALSRWWVFWTTVERCQRVGDSWPTP